MPTLDNQYTTEEIAEHVAEAQESLALGNDAQELGNDYAGYYAEKGQKAPVF